MLTKRIIPCLDVDAGRVVKGISFVELRDAGDPAELAAVYDRAGGDELVFLDITASSDSRDTMVDVVHRVSEEVFIPLTVGGGIRTVEDIRRMLKAGADKVSLNTAAVNNPALIGEGAVQFGNQCIVVAIDAKRVDSRFRRNEGRGGNDGAGGNDGGGRNGGGSRNDGGNSGGDNRPAVADASLALDDSSRWEVYTRGGRTPTGIDAVKWAVRAVELGSGEILLTSMDEDGQKRGYDLELTRAVSRATPVPVIASGGAGNLEHLYDALDAGQADAVLAASIFHFGEYSIGDAKDYLSGRGVPVRPCS